MCGEEGLLTINKKQYIQGYEQVNKDDATMISLFNWMCVTMNQFAKGLLNCIVLPLIHSRLPTQITKGPYEKVED